MRLRSVTPWLACGALALSGALLAGCGSSSEPSLQPAALGHGQCQASTLAEGSSYGQVAIAHGATCTTASEVADGAGAAAGASFHADGYSCKATKQGPTSAWTSSWGGDYVSYSCADGSAQVAFNWGQIYTYDEVIGAPSAATLDPASLGNGQCQARALSDGSTFAQIAVSDAACDAVYHVANAAASAAGSDYTSNGYVCVATPEGAGSEWAAAWSGTYYAYRCTFGEQRLAFTWGKDYIYQ